MHSLETQRASTPSGRPLDTLGAIGHDALEVLGPTANVPANSASAMPTQYILHDKIGAGGMATVHLGLLVAPLGFSRIVAVKRLHAGFSGQPEFAAMLVDEARIAARIRHPNVVPTLDVFIDGGACLVMEYIEGESLAQLLRATSSTATPVPSSIVVAVMAGVLHGLHAAHTACSAKGEALNIMHRDVSPQNIMVGTDGVARLFDFGVAKARGRLQHTRVGEFKGKLPYMAPEQFSGARLTQAIDIYSASVTLWEALTLRRLFDGSSEEEIFGKVLQAKVPAPSEIEPSVPKALDAVVLRGLSRSPEARFASAEEMALALERAVPPAPPLSVGAWVRELAAESLAARARLVARVEEEAASPPRTAAIQPSTLSEPARISGTASTPPTPAPVPVAVALPTSSRPPLASQPPAPSVTPTESAPTTTTSENRSYPSLQHPLLQKGWRRLRTAPVALLVLAPIGIALGWAAFAARADNEPGSTPASPRAGALVTRIANAKTSANQLPAPKAGAGDASPGDEGAREASEPVSVTPEAPSSLPETSKSVNTGAKPQGSVPRRPPKAPTYLESDPFTRRK